MAEGAHHSHKKLYIFIFFVLTFLTVVELIIPGMTNIAKFYRDSALVLLALGKAFLVAYYFMHLNEETKWTRFVAAIPISAGVYATVLILESMFR
ncbi:cytochrome C oxidase subunit IV family protein [Halobacteriovorax sp. HFRX-2_2]|uniref:cytochrome C oxidase subunit IV family protein n=1 Tax=unclassified Halobacteriovorax TaxID=2639665 RepID=UPI003720C89B